jgi:hypothetical protein
MDFADKITALARRTDQVEHLVTEEATKMALVVPFIAALGYDVYDPLEVVPEYTADVGIKKGEKVDYAIFKDGEPIMLFECKKVGVDLDKVSATQLYRYFSVSSARVGVVTDGVFYRFFSDIEADNKMDERPFLEIDIRNVDDFGLTQLKRFVKASFDLQDLLGAAERLKYARALSAYLEREFQSPSDELVRLVASQVYEGRFSKGVVDKFRPVVKSALANLVHDRIERRLQAALASEEHGTVAPTAPAPDDQPLPEGVVAVDGEVVTTQQEVDGYHIVRAIVAQAVPAERVHIRDAKSYCSVLFDDNNRKPICRLRFNAASKLYIGVFDAEKNETRHEIASIDDIYQHRDALLQVAQHYLDAGSA